MTNTINLNQICQFFDAAEDFKVGASVYSFADSVEIGLRPSRAGDSVYIMRIRSNDRGKGSASETLGIVCDMADEFEVDLFLEVEADDGLADRQLAEWYWRFGFRGSLEEMIRHPNSPD
jgi:hypothetical protein